jgi:MFS family permease
VSLGRGTFSSLSTRNYRLFFTGQLISISGTWMQTVAQSFLVLQLSNSGTTLGLTIAVRFAPMFVLGPWAGLIADRMDKRRILYVTQTASGLLALALGVLVATGAIELWMVYLLAALLGTANTFDNPARQALISEIVPMSQLRNAITLNSVTANLARVLGAAVGGIVAANLGLAFCFDLNAASFLAVLITLVMMSSAEMSSPELEEPEPGQIRAGLRYIRHTPALAVPLIMIAVIGTLAWEFQVSLPLLAKETFNGDAGTYAAMTTAMGAGAVVGGLVSASRAKVRMGALALAAIGWGIAITAAALAPTLGIDYAVLVFVGYGSISFNSLAKTALQLAAVPEMRGRVMAVWALAWQGSTPIGGPIIGWISEHVGPRPSLLAGGIPTILVGVLAYPVLTRIDREAVAGDASTPEGLDLSPGSADLNEAAPVRFPKG